MAGLRESPRHRIQDLQINLLVDLLETLLEDHPVIRLVNH